MALFVLGMAWITALTTLNGVTQSILPNWVRGRALTVYLTVYNGAMTAGSIAWGVVAETVGVPTTLWIGAAGLARIGLVMPPFKWSAGEADLEPSNHSRPQWPRQ